MLLRTTAVAASLIALSVPLSAQFPTDRLVVGSANGS